MVNESLTDSNFVMYCAKYYDNPACHSTEEFFEDVRRFKYIKKLFTRYRNSGELKQRIILNHFIVLYNVFGPHLARMVFLKLKTELDFALPFLILLNILPDIVYNVGNQAIIHTDQFALDQNIIEALRTL